MANENIKIKVTDKAPNIKGVCIQLSTKPKGRHFIKVAVKTPITPNTWNGKQMCFFKGEHAIEDNNLIEKMLEDLNLMASSGNYANGKQLKEAYLSGKRAESVSRNITFGEYLSRKAAWREKNATSTNYQLYKTLNNKMQGECKKGKGHHSTFKAPMYNGIRIYDMPIKDINNAVFKAFLIWINEERNGENYENTARTFHSVMREAEEEELTQYHLSVSISKYKPKKKNVDDMDAEDKYLHNANRITILTKDEWKRFLAFQPSELSYRVAKSEVNMQLTIDAMKLMYYLFSRPCDVLGMRWGKDYDPERKVITYTPQKLRSKVNSKGEVRLVSIPVSEEALEIINRYKGMSKGGYLLPFPFNDKTYDLNDPKSFKAREDGKKSTMQTINKCLKRIAEHLKLDVAGLSSYAFRHTALTHALGSENPNALKVAMLAGTSLKQLPTHYYNYIKG